MGRVGDIPLYVAYSAEEVLVNFAYEMLPRTTLIMFIHVLTTYDLRSVTVQTCSLVRRI
jgi:hypothetical protein